MTAIRLTAVAVFTGAVMVAAGLVTGLALRPVLTPENLQAVTGATSAPVCSQSFTDTRTVPISLTVAPPTQLLTGKGGRLTQELCKAGAPLASGTVAARIDDRPVIALHTTVPLYRDLGLGDRGDDVRALQTELTRLGDPVPAEGFYGPVTRGAVQRLQAAAGQPKPTGLLTLEQVAWMNSPVMTPTRCDAVLGQAVSAGAPLATADGALTALQVPLMPVDLTAGPRVLVFGGATGTLPATGAITDPGFLGQVAASDTYHAWLATKDVDALTATLRLAEPVAAAKIPPAALFALTGSTGCVQIPGDGAVPVTILGSGLGASLVTFAGPAPTSVAVGTGITTTDCGGFSSGTAPASPATPGGTAGQTGEQP